MNFRMELQKSEDDLKRYKKKSRTLVFILVILSIITLIYIRKYINQEQQLDHQSTENTKIKG